jgi:hypothetical protein
MNKFLAIFILLFLPLSLLQAEDEIRFQYVKKDCIIGEELSFAILVASNKPVSEDMTEIKYNGKTIPFEKNVSLNSMQTYINGKMTIEQTYKTNYIFTFNPEKEGKLDLTALTFKINDKTNQAPDLSFLVNSLPVSENFKLFINIKNKRDYYYPSEIIEVEVVLALKNYKDFLNYIPVLSGFDWLETKGLQYMPEPKLSHKVNINSKVFAVNLRKNSNTMNLDSYQSVNSYTLMFKVISPGEYKIENCRSKALIWTGRYLKTSHLTYSGQVVQDMEAVELYAACPPLKFLVKDVPEKNRPEDFSGAIGDFNIEVVSSNDTDLKVGDPVTLHINIIGAGAWDLVQCPSLHKMSSITDFFRIGSDLPAGEAKNDSGNSRKEFNVKLRVKSAAVKEIPPIPFSYFDISKAQYVTKYSNKIPLKVFENNNKVEVVTFENKKNNKITEQINVEDKNVGTNAEIPLKPIEIMSVYKGELLNINHQTNFSLLYLSFVFLLLTLLIVLAKKNIEKWGRRKFTKRIHH